MKGNTPSPDMLIRSFVFFVLVLPAIGAETLTLQGSTIVAQIMSAVAPAVRDELGIDLQVHGEGGSSAGLVSVGAGVANLAMTVRPIEAADRAMFPAATFDEVQIGWQVLVPAVARDVWESGVRGLTKEQLLGIYEGNIQSWKQVGGTDTPIKFYNPKRGRGVWELFVTWLYKDQRLAQLGDRFETVVSYKDGRDSVEFNLGSLTLLPPSFINDKTVFALGLKQADGKVAYPVPTTLAAKEYPLARPLFLVAGRRLAGVPKSLVDFMLSPPGQDAIASLHFLPIKEKKAVAEGSEPAN